MLYTAYKGSFSSKISAWKQLDGVSVVDYRFGKMAPDSRFARNMSILRYASDNQSQRGGLKATGQIQYIEDRAEGIRFSANERRRQCP